MAVLFYYRPQTKFPACITGHMTRGLCIRGSTSWGESGSREGSASGGPPSGVGQTPPPMIYYGYWSTSGRYASYWSAFLLTLIPFANEVAVRRCFQHYLFVILFIVGPHVTTTQGAIGESRVTWDRNPGHVQTRCNTNLSTWTWPYRIHPSPAPGLATETCSKLFTWSSTYRETPPPLDWKASSCRLPSCILISWEPKNWFQND